MRAIRAPVATPACQMPNLRALLLVTLAFTGFLLWQAWQQDYANRAPVAAADTPGAIEAGDPAAAIAPAADVPSAPATPAADGAAVPAAAGVEAAARGSVVTVTTDLLRVVIDTRGGTLVDAELLEFAREVKQPGRVRLLSDAPERFFVAQSGLVASSGSAPDHRANYLAAADRYELAAGSDSLEVPLTWTDGRGLAVTKTYRFARGSYLVEVRDTVANSGATAWSGSAYRQLQRVAPPVISGGASFTNPEAYSFVGAAWYSPEERFEKLAFDDFAENALQREITGGWSAMLQHYFFAAWIPPAAERTAFATQVVAEGAGAPRFLIRQVSPAQGIAPGASANFEARLFVGPKLQEKMAAIAPGLERTIDYGLVTFIAEPLFHYVLHPLYRLLGNWGWAIVFTTLLVKLLLYPLSEAQYRSMAKMRKLQPRLAALKERYGDDKQKYNQAMMELYQKEKINPMGGCLPILVQIPVFIALYWVLLESVELRQAPFILWIDNLSAKDPFFVLPILNGITMVAAQRLSPMTGMDPTQQKIMQAMPVVFAVMFAFFPAGLVLYWTVNGLLGLLQQWFIMRRVEGGASKA